MHITETIRRIKLAREVLEAIPDQSIDLETWYTRMSGTERCGTIACGAGWLSLSSEFNELGLVVRRLPNSDYTAPSVYVEDSYPNWHYGFEALAIIFGDEGVAKSIFAASGCSKLDGLLNHYGIYSDKDLLLARIDFWLEQNT